MAKKKKTKQQKVVADLRRQLLKRNLSNQSEPPVVKTVEIKKPLEKEPQIKVTEKKEEDLNYNYLAHDLKKTAILTSSVIALQIILYFALTNKILILPGLSY